MKTFLAAFYFILIGFAVFILNQNSGGIVLEVFNFKIQTSCTLFFIFIILFITFVILLWNFLSIFGKFFDNLHNSAQKKHLEMLQKAYYLFFANDLQKCKQELQKIERFLANNPDFQLLETQLSDDKNEKIEKIMKISHHKKTKIMALIILINFYYKQKNLEKVLHNLALLEKSNYKINENSVVFPIKIDTLIHEKELSKAKTILKKTIENGNVDKKIFALLAKTNIKIAKNHVEKNEPEQAIKEIQQAVNFDDSIDVLQQYKEILEQIEKREVFFELIEEVYQKNLQNNENLALKIALYAMQNTVSLLEKKDLINRLINMNENSYVTDFLKFTILQQKGYLEESIVQIKKAISKNKDLSIIFEGLKCAISLQDWNFCQETLEILQDIYLNFTNLQKNTND